MTEKQIIEKLLHALYIATERAVLNGNRIIESGQLDFNRGQFLSLINNVVKDAEKFIEIPKYNDFKKFK